MKYNFRQNIKRLCAISFALAIVIAGSQICGIEVMAGASDIVIDNTSFEKEIDTSKWNIPNGDVNALDGKLIFTKESTEDTKLITMEAAKVCDYNDELFQANYTLKLKSVAEGQKFVAGFSLEDVESSDKEESRRLCLKMREDVDYGILRVTVAMLRSSSEMGVHHRRPIHYMDM